MPSKTKALISYISELMTKQGLLFFTLRLRFFCSLHFSAPEGTRTPNQQNRNLSFYPIELRVQFFYLLFILSFYPMRRAELLPKQTTGAGGLQKYKRKSYQAQIWPVCRAKDLAGWVWCFFRSGYAETTAHVLAMEGGSYGLLVWHQGLIAVLEPASCSRIALRGW
jgi:hypothetical protein